MNSNTHTQAIILERPQHLALGRVELLPAGDEDVVVETLWSGISSGTERLLWSGTMPAFPGMGYPLVPGYETVGEIVVAGDRSGRRVGERVFVPGARCFRSVNGLFGGASARIVVPGARTTPVDDALGADAVLLALTATAYHALDGEVAPELIVGHGVLGRLMARLVLALGHPAPTVWESEPARRDGGKDYRVIDAEEDARGDYRAIVDLSGDPAILDQLTPRLAHGGEIVLAGFYAAPVSFAFPPAFMREARIRIAAEWRPADLEAVIQLVAAGRLSLSGLITHREPAAAAAEAYRTAFGDSRCLKMILNWRGHT